MLNTSKKHVCKYDRCKMEAFVVGVSTSPHQVCIKRSSAKEKQEQAWSGRINNQIRIKAELEQLPNVLNS